jgi:hypothetical protein
MRAPRGPAAVAGSPTRKQAWPSHVALTLSAFPDITPASFAPSKPQLGFWIGICATVLAEGAAELEGRFPSIFKERNLPLNYSEQRRGLTHLKKILYTIPPKTGPWILEFGGLGVHPVSGLAELLAFCALCCLSRRLGDLDGGGRGHGGDWIEKWTVPLSRRDA